MHKNSRKERIKFYLHVYSKKTNKKSKTETKMRVKPHSGSEGKKKRRKCTERKEMNKRPRLDKAKRKTNSSKLISIKPQQK